MRCVSQLIHWLTNRIREQARSHILISIHQVHGDLLWLLILGAPSNTLAVTEETDMYTITTIKNHIPIDSPPTPMLSYTSCFGCPAKGETGNR